MVYQLTDDDIAIFEEARSNGSIFTAYYFNNSISILDDGTRIEGWQFLPWQLRVHHGSEDEQTIIGGFGSGKTGGLGMSGFVWCATTPMFKFLEAAPVGWQSLQMFQYIVERLTNSRARRFVVKYVYRPYPKITLHNGSTMEFMSADEQGERIKTWEGDWVIIDQGEDVEGLDETIRNLGSRLRGRRPDGSERLGRLTVLANAGDNPELWDRYDQAETYLEDYLSMTISYKDNPYLSERDRKNLRRRAGGTPELIQQWLEGKRPIGKGEHFPWSMIEPCIDPALDDIMERAIREKRPGFVYQEAPKCGAVWWEMPPEKGRSYIVIGDGGQNDPPYRNSPVIMVWDVTNFPAQPMVLRCFRWIFGGGFYEPFLGEFERLVDQYHAHGQCAFDATGTQKAFDELAFTLANLLVEGMNVQGEKLLMINHTKMLMGRIMMKFPRLQGITHQLTHYKLPDTKIRQDIVSTIMMAAGWVRRLLWQPEDGDSDEIELEEGRVARSRERTVRSR
jgi:hypothetical protein